MPPIAVIPVLLLLASSAGDRALDGTLMKGPPKTEEEAAGAMRTAWRSSRGC